MNRPDRRLRRPSRPVEPARPEGDAEVKDPAPSGDRRGFAPIPTFFPDRYREIIVHDIDASSGGVSAPTTEEE
jgi:hypothetical protein